MAIIEIKVPDIGDFDEVTVIELLVKAGDTIKAEQSLVTVESDKASMEIPASHGGVVTALKVKLGDKVKQGSLVLLLESSDVAQTAEQKQASAPVPAAPPRRAPACRGRAAPTHLRRGRVCCGVPSPPGCSRSRAGVPCGHRGRRCAR